MENAGLEQHKTKKVCAGLGNRRLNSDRCRHLTVFTGSYTILLMGRTLNRGHMGNVGLLKGAKMHTKTPLRLILQAALLLCSLSLAHAVEPPTEPLLRIENNAYVGSADASAVSLK